MTAAPDQDQLTASGLAYLFPDRFPAPVMLGTQVIDPGSTMDAETSAIRLIVIALWSLQQSGYLELHPYAERHLWLFTSTGVHAVLLRSAEVAGIEGHLLRTLAADSHAKSEGAETYGLASALVPTSLDPFSAVTTLVEEALAAAGYLTKVQRPHGLLPILKLEPKWTYEPVPQRYPALTARVDALAQAWKSFLADPAYQAIRYEVREAIDDLKQQPIQPRITDTPGLAECRT